MPTPINAGMLPFDFETQNQQIAQKRQLLAALQAQQVKGAGPSGRMVGGNFVANRTEQIQPLLNAFQQRRGQSDLDAAQAQFSNEYQTALKSGVNSYMDNMEGKPAETMTTQQAEALMRNDVNPNLAEAQAPNPRKAIVDAMTSQLPELKALGQAAFAGQNKERETWTNPVKGVVNGKPALVQYSNRGSQRVVEGVLPESENQVVGGRVVSKDDPTKVVADYSDQWEPPFQRGGDWYQRNKLNGQEKKLDNAPKTEVNMGDKVGVELGKKLSAKNADMLEKSFEKAQMARNGIQSLDAAAADMDAGIKSGSAAEISLGLAKLAKTFGIDADPSIANTEAFRSNMARETFQLIKNLGTGNAISNADLVFAEKAAAGKITLDDGTMRRMIAVAKAGAAQALWDHEKLYGRTMAMPGGEAAGPFKVDYQFNGGEGHNSVAYNEKSGRFEVQGYATEAGAPGQRGAKPGGAGTPQMAEGWSVVRPDRPRGY